MSEHVGGVATTSGDVLAAEAGALLRQGREAMGLRIEVLAASLKVPVVKLQALESGNLATLPDRVFVRALAASMCRHVKIDPAPVLAKLPQTSQTPWTHAQQNINTPVKHSSQAHQGKSLRELLSRPVALAILALLIGAALIVFWPELRATGWFATASTESASPAPSASAAVVEPAATPGIPPPQAAPASVAPAFTPAAAASAAVVASVPASNDVLVFRARTESWVRVLDAKNAVAFQKTLAAGETAAVSGNLPLAVTIGRADAVDVQVRGAPFDLSKVSTSNVARFAVK